MNNPWFSKVAVWAVILLVMFTVFKQFDRAATRAESIGYSEFLNEVKAGRITGVKIQETPSGPEITATTSDNRVVTTPGTYLDRGLIARH